MNVTFVPEQIVDEGLAAMLTLAVTLEFTVIKIEFDVTGLPLTHAALDVITQAIASLLFNVLSEYIVLFVPTFTPFFFHCSVIVGAPTAVAENLTFWPANVFCDSGWMEKVGGTPKNAAA